MDPRKEFPLQMTRRRLLGRTATGMGAAALFTLLNEDAASAKPAAKALGKSYGVLPSTHFPPTAKRVIYLFQSGGPSHIDTFDFKPALRKHNLEELPASIRMGQRITGMTSGQKSFPCAAPIFKFSQHGQAGAWFSELMPNIASIADDICIVRSMHTEAINHDPATTYLQTGSQQPGRPSNGAWLSYGLGSANKDLPAYVVMISFGGNKPGGQPLFGRLWGSGFLPSVHQGVKLRSKGDPVLYLSDPPGINRATRRRLLDGLAKLNQMTAEQMGDPEINTRIAQYELAFRMQSSVPELWTSPRNPSRPSRRTASTRRPRAPSPPTA